MRLSVCMCVSRRQFDEAQFINPVSITIFSTQKQVKLSQYCMQVSDLMCFSVNNFLLSDPWLSDLYCNVKVFDVGSFKCTRIR